MTRSGSLLVMVERRWWRVVVVVLGDMMGPAAREFPQVGVDVGDPGVEKLKEIPSVFGGKEGGEGKRGNESCGVGAR